MIIPAEMSSNCTNPTREEIFVRLVHIVYKPQSRKNDCVEFDLSQSKHHHSERGRLLLLKLLAEIRWMFLLRLPLLARRRWVATFFCSIMNDLLNLNSCSSSCCCCCCCLFLAFRRGLLQWRWFWWWWRRDLTSTDGATAAAASASDAFHFPTPSAEQRDALYGLHGKFSPFS